MPISAGAGSEVDRSVPAEQSRVEFLGFEFDRLELDQLAAAVGSRAASSPFQFVVTPNVDHAVRANSAALNAAEKGELVEAYRLASYCACDSRILAALARLRGVELPVAPGSDLTARLLNRHLAAGDKVAIVGGSPETLRRLKTRFAGVEFVQHIPPMGIRHNKQAMSAARDFAIGARARYTFLSIGSPQQELLAAEIARAGTATGTALCVGASIDFVVGLAKRAPRSLQTLHLEWLHRLLVEPRRMWRRYLLQGPRIFWMAASWKPSKRQPLD